MSEKETRRAAIHILSQQLLAVEFEPGNSPDIFLAKFEATLDAIKSVTRDHFSSSVKKTILRNQLHGNAGAWSWDVARKQEFDDMDYDQFKQALVKEFSNGYTKG